MKRTFRLILEYDGAGFDGWQVQAEGTRTVQGELEAAVARICGAQVRVMGSGRTDAGVHAEGQVASVCVETEVPELRLRRALNGVLPDDVVVRDLREAEEGFDARRGAVSKLYRYSIWNGPQRSPLRASRALRLERPLDLVAVRRAAADLVGVHDFAAFQAAGSDVKTSVREMLSVDALGRAGAAVDLYFEGTGFLRHMVRILVGTLVQVGSGRRAPDSIPGLLASRDRGQAGPTVPANGLTLLEVRYAPRGDSTRSDANSPETQALPLDSGSALRY